MCNRFVNSVIAEANTEHCSRTLYLRTQKKSEWWSKRETRGGKEWGLKANEQEIGPHG